MSPSTDQIDDASYHGGRRAFHEGMPLRSLGFADAALETLRRAAPMVVVNDR